MSKYDGNSIAWMIEEQMENNAMAYRKAMLEEERMTIYKLELNERELDILKRTLNMNQNIETMEVLKQLEEQEELNGT